MGSKRRGLAEPVRHASASPSVASGIRRAAGGAGDAPQSTRGSRVLLKVLNLTTAEHVAARVWVTPNAVCR